MRTKPPLTTLRRMAVLAGIGSVVMSSAGADTYYVSTTGSDSGSGREPDAAWRHVAYAATQVAPGDTVYVERGDYGDEHVTFSTSGTADAPIVFAGYQTKPGDRPERLYSYGEELDPSVMPLLDGGDRGVGAALTLNSRRYVILKNFQIRHYETGVAAWYTDYCQVENVVVNDVGDRSASYSGRGFVFAHSNHNTLRDCTVVNAAAEGITVVGDDNLVQGCRVYADDDSTDHSAMDYYIVVEGNENILDGCYAERVGDLEHVGHGIGLKGSCENNLVIDCTGKNFSGGFYVRHTGARHNRFVRCTAVGGYGYLIRDGAAENSFVNCRSVQALHAVAFMDTGEDSGAQFTGRNNVFVNCIFEGTIDSVINFSYYAQDSSADHNRFVNCVIAGGAFLFRAERTNSSNELVNCVVTDVEDLKTGPKDLQFNCSYSNFWSCGFDTPDGPGVLNADPRFLDPERGNYRLTRRSPCIDASNNEALPKDITSDHGGAARFVDVADQEDAGQGRGPIADMGAYEYPARRQRNKR